MKKLTFRSHPWFKMAAYCVVANLVLKLLVFGILGAKGLIAPTICHIVVIWMFYILPVWHVLVLDSVKGRISEAHFKRMSSMIKGFRTVAFWAGCWLPFISVVGGVIYLLFGVDISANGESTPMYWFLW